MLIDTSKKLVRWQHGTWPWSDECSLVTKREIGDLYSTMFLDFPRQLFATCLVLHTARLAST